MPGRRTAARAGSIFVVRKSGARENAIPGRPLRSPARPDSSTSTVFRCGTRLTIFAPGNRLSARASWWFDWNPTTAWVIAGRLVDPPGARTAAAASAATSRTAKRGEVRARWRIRATRGAGRACFSRSAAPFGCGTLGRGMASPDRLSQEEHARVRVSLDGDGASNVSSGLPVLDHLLGLLARYGSLDLELQLAPEEPEAEVASAGRTLGQALREPLSSDEVRGHGSAVAAADDALAHIVLEASGRPLVVSNVDLSEARVGGLGTDLVASFLHELAEGGGFTLHVRLIDGDDPQHVLEAIFKALGVALAQAGRPRKGRE